MEKMSLTEKTCRPLVVGILGAALCLPGFGATYTGGDCPAANLIHRWSFNGDFTDSVGGLVATGVGTSFADNTVHTTGGGKSASYVSLDPSALPKDRPFTIEIFATPKKIFSWSRIFSFGVGEPSSDHLNNFFMSWTRTTNQNQDEVRFRYIDGTNAISVDDSLQPFTVGTKWHIVLAYTPNVNGDGKGRFYWSKTDLQGGNHRESSAVTAMAVDLSTWGMDGFYLGRSYWSQDIDADADYDEVRIWDVAFTPEQVLWSARLGADTLPTAAAAGAETATISFTAEAGGKVASNGAAASSSGSTVLAKNELVTLVAVPDANYHFTGWSGDLWAIQSGTASDTTITVYAASAVSLAASFRQNTATWTGAGDNNLWSTAANWQDSLLPVEHAQLVFNGNVRTTSQNDRVSELDKLTFDTSAAAQTLTGNGVELLALENLSAATQTVDLAVSAATGTLPIANSGNLVFGQSVTAPTLTLTGSGTTVFNQQGTSTTYNLDAGATVVFKGGLNGGTAIDLLNGGTAYLNGTSTLGSLRLVKHGTVLTIDGADTTITATGDLVGAQHIASGESTTININNGTVKLGTNLLTDNSDGTGGGTAKAGGNGTINQSGGDVTVSQYFVIGRDHVGTYNFTGGTLEQTKAGEDRVFIGEVEGATGTLNMSGDANLTCAGNFQVGRYGVGELNMSGGVATLTSWVSLARMATGVGTMNITSGRFSQTAAGKGVIVGENGKGALNISGNGVVESAGPVYFAFNPGASGEVSLTDGGTLKAPSIQLRNPSPFSSMYVNDATLVANGSGSVLDDFITVPSFFVGPKGMVLDTQDNTVILNRAFGFGSSEGPITKTGSGTLCMPASSGVPVKVQEGALASLPATAGGAVDGSLSAHLRHRWSFNGDFTDSVGGLDATSVGTEFVDNAVHTTGGGKAASYVSLDPNALPKDRPFTLEIFATPKKIFSWSRIFSFGVGAPNVDPLNNFFMSWTRGTEEKNDQVRFRYNGGSDAVVSSDSLQPFTLNTKWHIVLTYVPNVTADGKGRFFWSKTDLNGGNHREAFAITSKAVDLQAWGMDGFYLGRSYWTADYDAEADYDEVRIWDVAFTPEQIIASAKLGPDVLPGAELIHRWSFNGDAKDSIGGTTAQLVGAATLGDQMVATTGTAGSGYVNLGTNMLPADGSPVTIEIWATPHSFPAWSRVFDIGSNNANYLLLAWTQGTDSKTDRCEIKKGGSTLLSVNNTLVGYTLGAESHIAITVTPLADGKASLVWSRRDARTGALLKQGSGTTSAAWSIADIAGTPFYLGHSQYYPSDANANASYNEVRVWKGVLTDAQLTHNAALGPDVLPTKSAGALAGVDLAAGTTFTVQSGEAAVGKLCGVGTVSGSVTVVDTLDIAGEDIGTMTLDGDLTVKGTWLLDMDSAVCDLLSGTGTLDLSQATVAVRDASKLRGSCLLATVGEVTGYKQANVRVKGYKLFYNDNRLTLSSEGLCIFIR